MARNNYFSNPMEETFNPFETVDNSEALRANLDRIDNRNIRCKFKGTKDPINLAFESIENAPLKTLARDFVKESFMDMVSFISKICK